MKTSFRFNIGKFECLAVTDGTIMVPGPPEDPSGMPGLKNATEMDVISLFINTGRNKVLVDTGCGDGFQSTTGRLAANLEAAGIRCSDIDRVIITHGHLDHAGGSFDSRDRDVFPNARYMVAGKEWECWVNRPERTQLRHLFSAARRYFLPIPDRFDLLDDNTGALPGIKLMLAPGHTPGNSVLEISSEGQTLFCLGDTLHARIEFTEPGHYSFLDVDPEEAIRSRTQVPARLEKTGTLVFACHFPFPGLGRIVKRGTVLDWQPEKMDQLQESSI